MEIKQKREEEEQKEPKSATVRMESPTDTDDYQSELKTVLKKYLDDEEKKDEMEMTDMISSNFEEGDTMHITSPGMIREGSLANKISEDKVL